MLLSRDESTAVSNLGWLDKGSLWILSTGDRVASAVDLSDSAYLRLRPGDDDHLAVQHGGKKPFDRFEVTVHRLSAPAEVIARAVLQGGKPSFEGDRSVWRFAPSWYVDYLRMPGSDGYRLLRIDAPADRIEIQELAWFSPDRYDFGDQGVIDVTGVPGDRRLLISVQRSSTLVLHDPESGSQTGAVALGERRGNPSVRFLRSRPEAWADDYDTLVRLDAPTLRVRDTLLLQSAGANAQLFIGGFAFDRAERRCAVARPFSGDVAVVDVARFKITERIALGGEPLDVALTDDGRVFTRDWHTGELRSGRIDAG
jgi:hypothetical protein